MRYISVYIQIFGAATSWNAGLLFHLFPILPSVILPFRSQSVSVFLKVKGLSSPSFFCSVSLIIQSVSIVSSSPPSNEKSDASCSVLPADSVFLEFFIGSVLEKEVVALRRPGPVDLILVGTG